MNIYFQKQYNEKEFEYTLDLYRKKIKEIKEINENSIISLYEIKNKFEYVCALYASYLEEIIVLVLSEDIPFIRLENIYEKTSPFILKKEKESLIFEKYKQKNNEAIFKIKNKKKGGYIVFSSGTTGVPKGIFINFESLTKIINNQIEFMGLKKEDKINFAWILNRGFDASLSDLFIPFFLKKDLFIPDFKMTNFKKLNNFLEKNKITYCDIPPSIINYINYYPKIIMLGGEKISINEKIKDIINNENKIYLAYGPTEITICSSMLLLNKDNINNFIDGYIGVPISDFKYNVKDNELYISSDVHLGFYLDDNLNEKHFVYINGIYYYKSNDLIKVIDGKYIYIGRKDNQYKLNGQLINTEEIETIMNKRKEVLFTKVYVKDGKLYCDYILEEYSNIDILEYLSSYLHKYMLPKLNQIKKLNISKNGKKVMNNE
jgi:non-ribosomal peptide synthetase component F